MVSACAVTGCSNQWSPLSSIMYHVFPKDLQRRNLWLSILPLKTKFYDSARVCSLHFKKTDYVPFSKRLKPTAVPFIDSDEPCEADGSTSEDNEDETQQTNQATSSHTSDCEDMLSEDNVDYENEHPTKTDVGVQVKINSIKEEFIRRQIKCLRQKTMRQHLKIQKLSTIKKQNYELTREVARQNRKIQKLTLSVETLKKEVAERTEMVHIIQGRLSEMSRNLV